jgi:hypothetical protein
MGGILMEREPPFGSGQTPGVLEHVNPLCDRQLIV